MKKTAELVEYLHETETVDNWSIAENFIGFVIEDPNVFNPDRMPDGWKVGQISGSNVHIVLE